MIVYKVVRVLPDGTLVSAVMTHFDFKLSYAVGEKTCPLCGKILAFEDLAAAKRFVRRVDGLGLALRVYRAEATEATPICRLLDPNCDRCLEEFWLPGRGPFDRAMIRAPLGTVGCPDLTLLEEVSS